MPVLQKAAPTFVEKSPGNRGHRGAARRDQLRRAGHERRRRRETRPHLSAALRPGSKGIDASGLRNAEATGKAGGVPHPTLFILDQPGVIRVKLAREGDRDLPETAEIIAGVKRRQ